MVCPLIPPPSPQHAPPHPCCSLFAWEMALQDRKSSEPLLQGRTLEDTINTHVDLASGPCRRITNIVKQSLLGAGCRAHQHVKTPQVATAVRGMLHSHRQPYTTQAQQNLNPSICRTCPWPKGAVKLLLAVVRPALTSETSTDRKQRPSSSRQ